MPGLIELYAKIARIRVLSSPKIVEIAEDIGRKIVDTYLAPDKTFLDCGRWSTTSRSTFSPISVGPAAQNSSRFALNNSEAKGQMAV
jgi:hypothetical protein